MGSIRGVLSGKTRVLEPEHLVGRASSAAQRHTERYVSVQHALIRWTGQRWEVKDLGSRNGTFLNDARLKPGADYEFKLGTKIAFGKLVEEQWELIDDSPPKVMAVPLDEGEPLMLDGDLIALPSNEDPQMTIYRNQDGLWVHERPDESITPIVNRQTFEAAGRKWRFCCPDPNHTTSLATSPPDGEVRHLQLSFVVSRDEEHVQLQATFGGTTTNLGSRAFNYLLLTLARQRVADTARALAEGECGWVYLEDLAHDPTMAPPQLNIDIHRIRRQFATAGVLDPANIVERRPRTRQLRIGTGFITVTQL